MWAKESKESLPACTRDGCKDLGNKILRRPITIWPVSALHSMKTNDIVDCQRVRRPFVHAMKNEGPTGTFFFDARVLYWREKQFSGIWRLGNRVSITLKVNVAITFDSRRKRFVQAPRKLEWKFRQGLLALHSSWQSTVSGCNVLFNT